MRKVKNVVLTLALTIIVALSFMVEPAHADLAKETRLRVVPWTELREEHFTVYYGEAYKFIEHSLMDVTDTMASPEGLVYAPFEQGSPELNIYIVPEEHYVITSARIICGSVDYYSRGRLVDETHTIDITNPKLLIIQGEQMGFTDGQGIAHIEAGCSPNRRLPNNYTGPAYFSDLDSNGRSYFTIEIATEMENSGAFVLEETSTGTLLQAQYTITLPGGSFTGTAKEVNDRYAVAHQKGDVKPGDNVTIQYDSHLVGFILVQKGDTGFDDPKAPDWIEKDDTISFKVDSENRNMRIMFNLPPGSLKVVQGQNPLGFSTEIEISHLKNIITGEYEYYRGSVGEVNAKLAEWEHDAAVWNDDEIFFRLIHPEYVDSVTLAEKKIVFGREESLTPSGTDILKGSGWSITLTNQKAYEFQLNYHKVPGKVYIEETAPDQGIYGFKAVSSYHTVIQRDATAAKACAEMNADIEKGLYGIGLGTSITVTFPNNITSVRMAKGTNPSNDITNLLQNYTFTYTETVEDTHFYVVYKNSGGEIIINPDLPVDPDVPPFDPGIFSGGNIPGVWENPNNSAASGQGWGASATGCTCPWCAWMSSMYPGLTSGLTAKPAWSVYLTTAPAEETGDTSEAFEDTTVLAADEVYRFNADTDVLVTITPVNNYPVNVKLSYTVGEEKHEFQVSGLTGGPITTTVRGEVTIDVEMGETGFAAQMPTSYAVHMPEPSDGTAVRDHNTAVPGDTVTVAVLPNDGKEVQEVRAFTASGNDVPVHYEGVSAKGYRVFTFIMPAETVYISVTFETAGV